MIKPAYYNEHDLYAAQWLCNLIAAGHIAPGDVDTRSIEDVKPNDLRPYTQCHFFAGIGVWSLALRRAGWPDDRKIWTGSCPCQPFSAAGEGAAFADERHLWPAFYHLISQCQPSVVTGEQVAGKDANAWLDLVCADMEGLGFAFGALAFPSAGVGAPHIRDRTYWVADAQCVTSRCETESADHNGAEAHGSADRPCGCSGASGGMGHADGLNADGLNARRHCGDGAGEEASGSSGRALDGHLRVGADVAGGLGDPGPVNGLWRDSDWLFCRDGKWRPVEPGTFPLAHGAAARVGRLRAYGNAINVEAARAFIDAFVN